MAAMTMSTVKIQTLTRFTRHLLKAQDEGSEFRRFYGGARGTDWRAPLVGVGLKIREADEILVAGGRGHTAFRLQRHRHRPDLLRRRRRRDEVHRGRTC